MSKEKACAHFLGKPGYARLNCAQTIIETFKEKFLFADGAPIDFKECGGGKAPGGQCGSLYAAKVVLEKQYPDRAIECEQMFLNSAGATTCRAIRALRKLGCIGCVTRIAEYLENI